MLGKQSAAARPKRRRRSERGRANIPAILKFLSLDFQRFRRHRYPENVICEWYIYLGIIIRNALFSQTFYNFMILNFANKGTDRIINYRSFVIEKTNK